MAKLKMKFEVACSLEHDPEAECFVSRCEDLSLLSAGNTEIEAMKAMRSAIILYIQSAIEHKRLDAVLERAGLRFTTTPMQTPRLTSPGEPRRGVQTIPLEIPLYLLASQNLAYAGLA
ncbi:MAG: hypothetical protein JWQ87_3943 [Candidatus Sulfotelmatobacter sp.]|nr:hypothetical protein [Candidatus Sulfotelmatobacter sp.]